LIEPMRRSLCGGKATRCCFARARLIRHALVLLAVAVIALAVTMVFAAKGRSLMLAIGLTLSLAALLMPTSCTAIVLASEAGTTDPELDSAPRADSPQERDESVPSHRSRKPGVDSGMPSMGRSGRHAVECLTTVSQASAAPSSGRGLSRLPPKRIDRKRAFGADDDGSS
jgi:hypothetical protein